MSSEPSDSPAPTASADPVVVDRTIPLVSMSIGVCAVILAAASAFVAGASFAIGVVVGGAIAVSNFLVLARVGKALTGSRSGAALWGGVYLLKLFALFGGVGLLLHSGIISGLGLIVGLTALVPGIVVGGLLAAPRDPNDPAGTTPKV